MRLITSTLLLILLVLSGTANAQERYNNARFGFSFFLPPGFEPASEEAENGDGRAFAAPFGDGQIVAFGGNVSADSFLDEVALYAGYSENDGWDLTYKANGKSWGVYSGLKDDRILYTRFESQCDGRQFAAVQITYDAAQKEPYDPLVEALMHSLQTGECRDY